MHREIMTVGACGVCTIHNRMRVPAEPDELETDTLSTRGAYDLAAGLPTSTSYGLGKHGEAVLVRACTSLLSDVRRWAADRVWW